MEERAYKEIRCKECDGNLFYLREWFQEPLTLHVELVCNECKEVICVPDLL